MRRLIRSSRGNVAIEFALAAPIFITMMMALADYGRAMLTRGELDAAARAGLQVLMRDWTATADAISAAQSVAPDADVSTTVACICTNGTSVSCASGKCPIGVPRKTATVSLTESQPLLLPWPMFEDPMPLAATALGRLQ